VYIKPEIRKMKGEDENYMTKKKTWREKLLDTKDLPKVVLLKEGAQKHWKGK
jgi:hypothetical protein